MENAIDIYNALARPPRSALREIQAGKLKGKTDINPQWRYKAMTEKFGLVGIGWKYEVQKLWTEKGAGNEALAFAQVAVYVKDGDKWSEPIVGIGGSKLVQLEKGAAVSNDEGYKMAVTDAFSTALKMFGVAADIYAGLWDGSKYRDAPPAIPPQNGTGNKKAALGFEPKGGETTPEEKKEISNLLLSKTADGQPIFSKAEMKAYSDKRKDYTAREVIDQIKTELQKRLAPANPADLAEQAAAEEVPPEELPAQVDVF